MLACFEPLERIDARSLCPRPKLLNQPRLGEQLDTHLRIESQQFRIELGRRLNAPHGYALQ
jgi:hypothetical protein